MNQDFKAKDLKAELEQSLGFGLRTFERLPGRANSLNFAAQPDSGERFVVKCAPRERTAEFRRLVVHLDELDGTVAVRHVHRRALAVFSHYNIVCLSWCKGVRLSPDRLSRDGMRHFLDEYLRFSESLQRTSAILPPMDPRENMRHVQDWFHGPLADRFKAEIRDLMDPDDLTYRPSALKVIHGDFHHGNFLFADGRLSGIFDLEEFRYGYPAEDIVRYFVCASEHLRWFEVLRRRRIREAFAETVRYLPYPRHEWMVAINGLHLRMLESRAERGYGPLGTIDLRRKSRLYAAFRRIVEEHAPGGRR